MCNCGGSNTARQRPAETVEQQQARGFFQDGVGSPEPTPAPMPDEGWAAAQRESEGAGV
jgi:hypothetical protein